VTCGTPERRHRQALARPADRRRARRVHLTARRLRRLQERLAEATGRDVEQIAADMRTGRLLSTEEAREYGLVDR